MIDIHSHILYGLDDGARDFDESIRMIQMAYDNGIRTIVATSHYIPDTYPYRSQEYESILNQLNNWILLNKLDFQILGGNELYLTREGIIALVNKKCRSINQSKYVLTEISDFMSHAKVDELLELLTMNGFVPVIAHVERLNLINEDRSLLTEWVNKGYLLQVNSDSIVHKEYKKNHKIAKYMLKHRFVHIVASDCHRIDRRRPILKESYDYIKRKYGEQYANLLFMYIPDSIIKNKNIDLSNIRFER